jgi:hypothetical protein
MNELQQLTVYWDVAPCSLVFQMSYITSHKTKIFVIGLLRVGIGACVCVCVGVCVMHMEDTRNAYKSLVSRLARKTKDLHRRIILK